MTDSPARGPLTPARAGTLPTLAVRDRAISLLSDAFAQGALEMEEFERRVNLAHTSDSAQAIDALLADLPVPAGRTGAPPPAPTRELVPRDRVRASGTVLSVMGGSRRVGTWSVPRRLTVFTLMGGAEIDLREALLPAGEVELTIVTIMGGVQVIVPPHLAVSAEGSAIAGGFEHVERLPSNPDPGAPLLRIRGLAAMGGVNVEMRLPGETEREARKRRRRERRGR